MNGIFDLHEANAQWDGYKGIRGLRRPDNWNTRMASLHSLMENHRGDAVAVWQGKLYEAMSTTDFPLLFSDIIDRELQAEYKALPRQMRMIFKKSTLKSFRNVKRFFRGQGSRSLQEVEEKGMYKQVEDSAKSVEYALKKYGALKSFTWEGIIDDDLDFFANTATQFAESASNTEERLLTGVFWDAAGAIDTFFAAADGTGQQGVSNLPLTRLNLETAIQEMSGSVAGFRSDDDEPILNNPRFLVVPPSLQLTAEEILSNAPLISGNTVANTSENMLANRQLVLLVNPWIPVLVTTGTLGATSWGLFSDTIVSGEMGLLMGKETPEIFLRSSNSVNLSGGDAGPMTGSFDTDSIDYKIRMCMGQTAMDPRGGWASDGQ